jgi:hypothetical protein
MTLGIAGKEAEVIVLRTTEVKTDLKCLAKTVASGYDDSFKRYVQSRLNRPE